MVASTSGFVVELTYPPTSRPTGFASEAIECEYKGPDNGVCIDRVVEYSGTSTFSSTLTAFGRVQPEVLPVLVGTSTATVSKSTSVIQSTVGLDPDDSGAKSAMRGKNGGVAIMILFPIFVILAL
ncbi:hypothetical protein K435DRAFT_439987 [Dendrothele bispora CBS 962.96]|nr:hypothetical protein K435DRAFT_439987 [Dendrothele bispora CBS 962.96]